MTKLRFLLFISIILLCVNSLYAGGSKEKETPASTEKTITLDFNKGNESVDPNEVRQIKATGTVRLVGTGTFNDLVISGEHEWYIAKEDREKLHQYQQQTVTVEAEETARELKFANGMSAGIRRELRNIKIISVN